MLQVSLWHITHTMHFMHKFSLIKMYAMFDLKVIERSRSFENVKNEFSTLKLVELHMQHVSVSHI